jgi:hypothetical protein
MLTRMLLHVIEAAHPIDAAVNRPWLQLAIDDVHDVITVVAHLKDVGIAKLAAIARLATRTRIQRRLIEHNFPRRRRAVNARLTSQHLRFEIAREGIVIVDAVSCHLFGR